MSGHTYTHTHIHTHRTTTVTIAAFARRGLIIIIVYHVSTDAPPVRKIAEMDKRTEEDSKLRFTVVFSMKEGKGALVKALELCQAHQACRAVDR